MEQNGTLPIVHTVWTMKATLDQLNIQKENMFVSLKTFKDANGHDVMYWPDGFQVYAGGVYTGKDFTCKQKFYPNFKSSFYGIAKMKSIRLSHTSY